MWEVRNILRFLSTGHGIMPYCGCMMRETVVANANLFFEEARQLTKFA